MDAFNMQFSKIVIYQYHPNPPQSLSSPGADSPMDHSPSSSSLRTAGAQDDDEQNGERRRPKTTCFDISTRVFQLFTRGFFFLTVDDERDLLFHSFDYAHFELRAVGGVSEGARPLHGLFPLLERARPDTLRHRSTQIHVSLPGKTLSKPLFEWFNYPMIIFLSARLSGRVPQTHVATGLSHSAPGTGFGSRGRVHPFLPRRQKSMRRRARL